MVLAGAGSGKTRVLTHRIVWLIEDEKISPFNILAVTFTNKAANEMRSRIETMLHCSLQKHVDRTFHGLSHRFLRAHWQEAGLPQTFQILDSDDQFRMIRRVIHALNLDEDRFPPKEAQWFINAQKEEGREPHQVELRDFTGQTFIKIYQLIKKPVSAPASLILPIYCLKTYKLLQTHAELRAHYQARFRCLVSR